MLGGEYERRGSLPQGRVSCTIHDHYPTHITEVCAGSVVLCPICSFCPTRNFRNQLNYKEHFSEVPIRAHLTSTDIDSDRQLIGKWQISI